MAEVCGDGEVRRRGDAGGCAEEGVLCLGFLISERLLEWLAIEEGLFMVWVGR